jgi:hypothetical protein
MAVISQTRPDPGLERGGRNRDVQIRHLRHQIDIVLVGSDRFHRGADRDRSLQADRDRGQQRIVRPGEPLADAFIAALGRLLLRGGELQPSTDRLDDADELGISQMRCRIHVVHCSNSTFRLVSGRAQRRRVW